MASELILVDTSVLIDYFRKKNKEKSHFYGLAEDYSVFAVSVITEYEILVGSNSKQDQFWNEFFSNINILAFDSEINRIAIDILRALKENRKNLDIPDLIIGATALRHNIPLAKTHFKWISNLQLL